MARHRIRRLPVVDARKRLVGMLTLGDLAAGRVRGTEQTLHAISAPAEPDRPRGGRDGGSRSDRRRGDAPWPPYGEAGG